MYKNVLQGIDNVAIWPVISFVIFFLFFICLIWWVMTTDNKFITTMKNLPLDNSGKGHETTVKNKTGEKS